jgi:hypothetical protein
LIRIRKERKADNNNKKKRNEKSISEDERKAKKRLAAGFMKFDVKEQFHFQAAYWRKYICLHNYVRRTFPCVLRNNFQKQSFEKNSDEKVFANTPTNNKGNKIFYTLFTCFNPDLDPLQVLFYN